MKKVFLISVLLKSVFGFSQDSHTIIDIGVNKHSKDLPQLTYTLSAKNLISGFGLWGSFIGLDKDKSVTSTSPGEGDYTLSTYTGRVYGIGYGVNYSIEKWGLTFSAGTNMVSKKTIVTYYNTAVTPMQNQSTPYKYYTKDQFYTARLFVDYDFMRKHDHFELGIRAGYDTYSSFEVGAFMGYKFTKK